MKTYRALLYLLILLIIGTLIWLVFFFVPGGTVETAEVLLPTPSIVTETSKEVAAQSQERVVSVTTETVQAAIGSLARAGSYARTLTAERFSSGGSSVRTIDVWVSGDASRFQINDSNSVKNVLIIDEDAWIWYTDADHIYHGPAAQKDADQYQGLDTYEDLLALPVSAITDAGYTDYAGESCIFAQYSSGELGYITRWYVSVATGLLMGSETMDGETLVYRLTSSAPDISTQDESIFALPATK